MPSPPNTTLGDPTQKVSPNRDLLTQANVTGNGPPPHTPNLAAQTYVDVLTGIKYEWWAGAWHPPVV